MKNKLSRQAKMTDILLKMSDNIFKKQAFLRYKLKIKR